MENKGFTIIELIITMAIIGVLSAVIAPSLQGKKTKEESVSEKVLTPCSNLK